MADVPRDEWIPEVPFDVSNWGADEKELRDTPSVFKDEKEREAAAKWAKKNLPTEPPVFGSATR